MMVFEKQLNHFFKESLLQFVLHGMTVWILFNAVNEYRHKEGSEVKQNIKYMFRDVLSSCK